MRRSVLVSAATLILCASPAVAHRIDEYLQAATLLVSSGRLQLELRLAPGSEIARKVLESIDLNRDGVLSGAEQRSYALRVMRDLYVTLDSKPIVLSLTSVRYDRVAALVDGTGEIQLAFAGDLPSIGEARKLVLENRHRPEMSVYLANSLVPDDPAIRIVKQERNYSQSTYTLEYAQRAVTSAASTSTGLSLFWLLAIGGFVIAAFDELRRRIMRRSKAELR
jgi:hypothetical protein